MNHYELVCLIPLKYTEKKIPQIITQINETVKKNQGAVVQEENWGKKKIAYPLKQNRHGYYFLARINAQPENIVRLDQELKNSPEIVRYSITKFKPGSFDPKRRIAPEESAAQSSRPLKEKEEKNKISPEESLVVKSALDFPQEPSKIKKPDRSKVALEDLDKKLEQILSDNNFNP